MATKDVSISIPVRQTVTWKAPYFNPTSGTAVFNRISKTTRTRVGSRLPHWRDVIARGGNATTGMTATWDTAESNIYYGFSKWNTASTVNNSCTVIGDIMLSDIDIARQPRAPIQDITATDNRARAKFYKALRAEQVAFSGPTFLGELRETLHMIRRPASALWSKNLGYLDALSKAKRASPKHWTKSIAGLWLEHSFGWTPLIHDCEDGVKAFTKLVTADRRKVISAGYSDEFDRTSSLSSFDQTYRGIPRPCDNRSGRAYNKMCYLKEEVKVRYKGALKPRVEAAEWDKWAIFGFTPSELIPTAWELLPWSFLIDYFTNVGDILSSSVTSTADVAFVNKTIIQKTVYWGSASLDKARTLSNNGATVDLGTGEGVPGSFKLTRRVVNRSANTGVPLPTFTLDFNLSNGQLFNIAALLGQARALHPQQTGRKFRYDDNLK